MADKKISALTTATAPLAGTEVLPIVQSGSTVKVTVANLTAGRTVGFSQLSGTGAITTTFGFDALSLGPATGASARVNMLFKGTDAAGNARTSYVGTNVYGTAGNLELAVNISGLIAIGEGLTGNFLVMSGGKLGYGTGTGGAITQITDRITGVTLNKTNGAITLVSAAGSAAWQSFTVTNNKVAATDTVIINQKSGTDLYQIFVTAVADGSFRVTYATTGGTTVEQPVFNFAIIRAVAA